jgi:opacity protein-like surface antigen
MVGRRLQICALAAACSLAASAALAADYPQPPPPPIYMPPPVQDCCDSWYLRGFVGVGMNVNPSVDYTTTTNATFRHADIADVTFAGAGVGYEYNNWLRFEATAEYRTKSRVYAFVTYPPGGLDEYQGYLKSWIFLANAFVDLGTWNCFTPFVGAGIGTAYNNLADFTDTNPTGGYGFGRNPTHWDLAWALYAGVSYEVTKNFKVDLTYRYLNYGSITDTVDCSVTCSQDSFKFDKLQSHDIMLGLRWTCCDFAPPQPQYVYAPPPPVYAPPPPVYSPPPPPLRSKG